MAAQNVPPPIKDTASPLGGTENTSPLGLFHGYSPALLGKVAGNLWRRRVVARTE